MQLDTEEGETFVPPAGVVVPSKGDGAAPAQEQDDPNASTDADNRAEAESETDA